MAKAHSIKRRIYILFASFTLFTCLSYSILLLGYSWVVEDNVFNRIVSDEADYIQTQFAENGTIIEPRSPFLTLYESWQALPVSIYQQHLRDPAQIEFTGDDIGTLHLRPIELGTETYILVADVSVFEVGGKYLPYISLSLIAVLVLFSLLALAFAWPVASAASKPLIQLKNNVEAIDLKEFKSGFAKDFPNNEIGFLAHEIERSMLHIQTVLKRESDFTRDVSHELRTPTTILKNLASQAEENPALSPKQIDHLTGAVQDLEQTIDTLLALAREETQHLQAIVFLNALENCIIKNMALSKQEDFELDIDIPQDLTIEANANLLALLINNLLMNALTYASEKRLKIYTCENTIVFENPAARYEGKNPMDDRNKGENSKGLGLGLYLVERICTVFGWHVSVTTENGLFSVQLNHSKA